MTSSLYLYPKKYPSLLIEKELLLIVVSVNWYIDGDASQEVFWVIASDIAFLEYIWTLLVSQIVIIFPVLFRWTCFPNDS